MRWGRGFVRTDCERVQIGRPTDETTRAVLRAAMDAIRAEADSQLAAVLTPEELERLRATPSRPDPTRRWVNG